jgi:two-component system, OmpR family, response regulator
MREIKSALIIDDEEDICILLSSYLRKKNILTHYSLTLTAGLELLKELKPSIVFLDNNLPDGSGIESIPLIRSQNSRIKIIVISAMSNLREKALNFHADAFIDKPISFENIRKLI